MLYLTKKTLPASHNSLIDARWAWFEPVCIGRTYMYPGLETACATHRVLDNREWLMVVTSLIIHELL